MNHWGELLSLLVSRLVIVCGKRHSERDSCLCIVSRVFVCIVCRVCVCVIVSRVCIVKRELAPSGTLVCGPCVHWLSEWNQISD